MTDHETLIRIESKLDDLLEWKKEHKTEHMRTRLVVWGALLAAIFSCLL
jgi:hypothetical protein